MIRTFARWAVPLAALAVIVVGLTTGPTAPEADADRSQRIAEHIKCPFCSGESVAEATSQVARDLRIVIDEQVAAGMSDEEIYAFFAGRYGDSVLLDPPASGWGVLLWALPAVALVAGIGAILSTRRSAASTDPPRRPSVLAEQE